MAQRVVDLSLLIEDNMPAHKLFQRPVITTHLSHQSSKAFDLGAARAIGRSQLVVEATPRAAAKTSDTAPGQRWRAARLRCRLGSVRFVCRCQERCC